LIPGWSLSWPLCSLVRHPTWPPFLHGGEGTHLDFIFTFILAQLILISSGMATRHSCNSSTFVGWCHNYRTHLQSNNPSILSSLWCDCPMQSPIQPLLTPAVMCLRHLQFIITINYMLLLFDTHSAIHSSQSAVFISPLVLASTNTYSPFFGFP
jgi:hypothetical protein